MEPRNPIQRRSGFFLIAAVTLAACNGRSGDTQSIRQPASAAPGARAAARDVHKRTQKNPDQIVRKRLNRVADGVPGRYIVVLETAGSGPGSAAAARPAEVATKLAARHRFTRKHVYERVLHGFAAQMSEAEAARLAQAPEVAYVVEDVRAESNMTQTDPPWGLDRIGQRNLPLNGHYTTTTTGLGVHAYVLDTGILPTHQEFAGRATIDLDVMEDGQNGVDCNGHGTHVAGTIGGATYGVAKDVRLHALRVLDCFGSGLGSGIIAALDWVALNHVKPAVVNMSLGMGAYAELDDAVRRVIAAGVTVVVAAGNSWRFAEDFTPSRVQEAITVGAMDFNDLMAGFSNFGRVVDLYAPGVDVASAWFEAPWNAVTASGTSMASPHVAGAAALYLESNPTSTPAAVEAGLLASTTRGVVKDLGAGPINRLLYSGLTAPPARPALFVVGNTTLSASDTALRDRLVSRGFSVTVKSATALVSGDATGKAVVVVSSSVNSSDVGNKLTTVTTPVVCLEGYLFDDLDMTGDTFGTDYGETATAVTLDIRHEKNPLAGGIRENTAVTVSTSGKRWWGVPSAEATGLDGRPVTLTSDSGKAAMFGYEQGSTMVGRDAPARRVGVFADETSVNTFTADGWSLFDGAVEWATSPVTEHVNELLSSVYAWVAPGQASLAWLGPVAEMDHLIMRSSRRGGPYTTINTIQTVGVWDDYAEAYLFDYVDPTVTNGQTYYYVVVPVDEAGRPGRASFEARAHLGIPEAPPALTAYTSTGWVPQTGEIIFMGSWLEWRRDAGGQADFYEVGRSDTSTGPFTAVGNAYGTAFRDETAQPGHLYYYRLKGVNAFGVGPFSEVAEVFTETFHPGIAVTGLTVTPIPGGVRVKWNHVFGAARYRVQAFRGQDFYATYDAFTPEPDHTIFLPGGAEYLIRVAPGGKMVPAPWATATATPGTGSALLVVGQTPLPAADQALQARLEGLGLTVTARRSADLTTADATGRALVVVSSTAVPAQVGTKLTSVAVPVLTMEAFTLVDLGMTGPAVGSHGVFGNQTTLAVELGGLHPLAAGNPRSTVVTTAPSTFGWSLPLASATNVARVPRAKGAGGTSPHTVFGYERGAALIGQAAPARRLAFLVEAEGMPALTPDGKSLFDAAAHWALDPAVTDPAAPQGVTATVTGEDVTVSWQASPGASGYAVMRAHRPAYMAPKLTVETVEIIATNVTGTSYLDTTPGVGARYRYFVASLGASGGSGHSAPVAIGVNAPPPAPTLTAAGLAGTVRLTIDAPEAQTINVLRATQSGGPYTVIAPGLPGSTTLYTDSGLTNGTPYFYAVEAVNAQGVYRSMEAWAAPWVPTAPVGQSAIGSNGRVALSWFPVPGARAYSVGRSADGSYPPLEIVVEETTAASAVDVNVPNGQGFTWFITALGGPGVSSEPALTSTNAEGQALFVRPATPTAGDIVLRDRLIALGFQVTERSDSALVAADANGKDLAVVSASVTSGSVGNKLTNVAVPVLSMESFIFDDMKMTGTVSGTDFGSTASQTQIDVLDVTHPMAARLSGVRTANTTGAAYGWGWPSGDAAVVGGLLSGGPPGLFAYQVGAQMVGMTAPARRVGLFLEPTAVSSWTTDGRALFDAAVKWAAGLAGQ